MLTGTAPAIFKVHEWLFSRRVPFERGSEYQNLFIMNILHQDTFVIPICANSTFRKEQRCEEWELVSTTLILNLGGIVDDTVSLFHLNS